jgi:hypothetical protein
MFPVVNDAKSGNEVRQSTDEVIRARFKGIETVYKEYGDINTSIFDWYRNIGRHIFDNWENRRDVQFLGVLNGVDEKDQSNLKIKKRTQQYIEMISGDGERPKTMLLAIPFDLPKSIALKHVQTLIDAHYDWILEIEDIEYRKKKPLASKRERPDALIRKLKVLICKAFHPNMPLWKIGLISGISSKHDYRMSDKKLSDDEKIALRPEIATLTSRALRQGQYIAEHAALDSFPVTDKIKIPIYEWDVVKARILLAYPKLKVFDSLAEYY